MRVLLLLCTVISLNTMASVSANADDSVILAYYVEMEIEGGTYQLQQYGRPLSTSRPIVVPIGLGGKGKFQILLEPVVNQTGKLVIEYYSDKGSELSNALPYYSQSVDFKLGLPGEIKQSEEDLSINFSFNVVDD